MGERNQRRIRDRRDADEQVATPRNATLPFQAVAVEHPETGGQSCMRASCTYMALRVTWAT
jgi:hypothetical protein